MNTNYWLKKYTGENVSFLLFDMKGKCLKSYTQRDQDDFFVSFIAMSATRRRKQFVKWKIASFVLITISARDLR